MRLSFARGGKVDVLSVDQDPGNVTLVTVDEKINLLSEAVDIRLACLASDMALMHGGPARSLDGEDQQQEEEIELLRVKYTALMIAQNNQNMLLPGGMAVVVTPAAAVKPVTVLPKLNALIHQLSLHTNNKRYTNRNSNYFS